MLGYGADEPWEERTNTQQDLFNEQTNAGSKDAELDRLQLLEEVVAFKRKFYRCALARYEEATPRSIRLVPPESAWSALESDYAHMQNMIFGPRPSFREIMDVLRALGTELHATR